MIAETDDVTVTRFALTVDPSRQWVRVLRLTASGDRGDLERAFRARREFDLSFHVGRMV